MNLFPKRKKKNDMKKRGLVLIGLDGKEESFCISGYKSLDQNPDIMTACRVIAETIGMMTIHLMENTSAGDKRIINELSRKIDISPSPYMTRKTLMEAAVLNALLYGNGNAVIRPRTKNGILEDFELIQPRRVSFQDNKSSYGYKILIDGVSFDPEELIHIVINPDPERPWLGKGLRISLKDLAESLQQADATKKGFMSSKWKPSIIIKVDALADEFASPEGREKLMKEYIETSEAGTPWMVPAELFSVEQVRPLSLTDLAIIDAMTLDKKMVAAVTGVPPFILGVGDYSKDAWNGFVNRTIKSIVTGIQQELTRKLILSPKWYLKLNSDSLNDWDLDKIAGVYFAASDRGFVTGNEVREKIHLEPREGLDELRTLENYIPNDRLGDQKKLTQEGEENA